MGGPAGGIKVEDQDKKPGDDKKPGFDYAKWLASQKDLPDDARRALSDFDPSKAESFSKAIQAQKDLAKQAEQKRLDAEKKLAEAQAEKDTAESNRLKEAEQFKPLYEQTAEKFEKAQVKLKELEPALKSAGERIETMKSLLQNVLDSQLKTLEVPKHVSDLLAKMSVEEQLNWLTDNREALTKREVKSVPNSPDEKQASAGKAGGADDKVEMYDHRSRFR